MQYGLLKCTKCGHRDIGLKFLADIEGTVMWYCPNPYCTTNRKGIEYSIDYTEELICKACGNNSFYKRYLEHEPRCARCDREYISWRRTKGAVTGALAFLFMSIFLFKAGTGATVGLIVGMITGAVTGWKIWNREKN